MKKLECFRSVRNITDAAEGTRFSGKHGLATMSALLIASLFAVGCNSNNKESMPAAGGAQTSNNQMALNQPVISTPVSSPAVTTSAPAPKKVVRKRPSTTKYTDQTSGVSFRYPWQYSVKSGDAVDSDSVPMDFVQEGGETTVSVDVPKGFYPETDFAASFFRVNVNRALSEEQCNQFASAVSTEDLSVQPSKVALGSLEMQELETITGDDDQQGDIKYYHLFQNGACYEFALGLSTQSVGDDETVTPVDRVKVFRRLEAILATVKLNPETTPQVTAGSVTAPATKEGSN
jgi:hypothetical protein